MTQEKDEAREQFEHWAGGKLNLPLDRKSDGEFQLDYGYEPLNYMFVGFEAGRLAGLAQAAKIAEHFANDELTAKEWPKYGLCERSGRFDYGAIGETGDKIAAAIREAEGVSKNGLR
jgi:hypothetical protein